MVQPLDYLSALFGPLDTQLLDVLNFIFVLVSVTRYSDMVVECGHLTLHFSPKACQTFFFFYLLLTLPLGHISMLDTSRRVRVILLE